MDIEKQKGEKRMGEEPGYFPIFINLKGKTCILYGGGEIAARRAAGLLRFGARVVVIAPKTGDGIGKLKEQYPQSLQVKEAWYQKGIPQGDFVFSCTDDKWADLEIYQECKMRKIPVNIASDQSLCDFLFPALAEGDGLVVGVSSGGRNHRKVRQFTRKLREWMGGEQWK